MSNLIVSTDVAANMRGWLFQNQGTSSAPKRIGTALEYSFKDLGTSKTGLDFATMLLTVSLSRASRVEDEVTPQAKQIEQRNAALEELGKALSAASNVQAQTQRESPPVNATDNTNVPIAVNALKKYYTSVPTGITNDNTFTPGEASQAVQLLKSKIDNYNNLSQTDMTRLQSLIDKRDDAYSLGSDLVSGVSDSISATIRNIQ